MVGSRSQYGPGSEKRQTISVMVPGHPFFGLEPEPLLRGISSSGSTSGWIPELEKKLVHYLVKSNTFYLTWSVLTCLNDLKLISLNFPIKKDLINKLSNIKLIKKTNWNFFTLVAGAKPPRRQKTETEASSRIAKKDCNHNTFFLMRRISAPRSASWGSGTATELATVFLKHQTLSVL